MSPRTGRPKTDHPKAQRFSIRLDDELGNKLDEFCRAHALTRAEVIRLAIAQFLGSK